MLRPALTLVAAAALLYAALCALMYLVQRSLIYFPQATRVAAEDADFALRRDTITLRGWIFNRGAPDAVLYFGGNAERVQDNRQDFARWAPGRRVYALAYRGYGASDGRPDEAALYADALALYDDVRARHRGQRIAVVGRSLGSGVAAYVAARREVDAVALITPFDSLAEVAQAHVPWLPARRLLHQRFDTRAHLAGYRGPVLILRAGRDSVVPAANTARLIAALPHAQTAAFADAGHNDLHLQPGFTDALRAFLR